jgi:GH35 family endo-1,4-beta-xylanase
MADRPDPSGGKEYVTLASKDFRVTKTYGWTANQTTYGFSLSFGTTTGLNVTTTTSYPWQVQFVPMDNIQLTTGQTYKLTMTVKGTSSGQLDGRLGDWGGGASFSIPFTTEWNDVEVNVKPTVANNFILVHVPNFVGTVNIRTIKIEGYKDKTIPQTKQEKHDTLVYAMNKWIKGMMLACGGKVKAWDLVNEAISGGGNDGQGNYALQHSEGYNSGTWDVGGDAFYWQDYMGDLDYVRQACRLARKYGPEDVKLFINDYNLEGTWDIVTKDGISASKKIWSLVNWIKKWEADGVTKIDGIGTQMHISFNKKESAQNSLKNAITGMFKLMAKSGKMVRVSELDMGYNDINGNSVPTGSMTEAQHKEMADFYEWIIKQFLTIVPPEQQWGICQWCSNDSQGGWRANTPVGIWDVNNYRKHVYAGFVRGLNGGEPTEIDNVKAEEKVDTSKGIYNINGVRMSATSIEELPAGFYIVNGKKIFK